jgi:micrococcal nuclease
MKTLFALVVLAVAVTPQPTMDIPAGYHIGRVRYVTDGDTFAVTVSKSQWIVAGKLSIRVANIDTPEKLQVNAKCLLEMDKGKAATAYAKRLLPVGSVVRFYPVGKDKYFRIDAHVIMPDGRDYGKVMLESGYAKPWIGRTSKPEWCKNEQYPEAAR